MEPITPQQLEIDTKLVASHGHSQAIGLRFVASGDDWAEMAFDYDPKLAMSAETGVLASGPLISLIDSASAVAILAKTGRGRPMATLDMRIDYVRASKPGRPIIARGQCYRVARNVAFVRCDAHDGDPTDLVAHAICSFYMSDE